MRLHTMGPLWVLALCLILSVSGDEIFPCPGNYNCTCALEGHLGYELTCPSMGNQKITVNFKAEHNALLVCNMMTESEDYKLLADVQILPVERLRFRLCPLPEAPFTEVLKLRNAADIKILQFDSYRHFNNSLERRHFTGLSGIKRLLLSFNGLTVLPSDLLMDMPRLEALDISNNRVQLPEDLLQPVLGIQTLDLGSNELTTLPPGLFRNLKKLNFLNLWKNKLMNLSPEMFSDLSSLASLELSNNGLTSLPSNVFQYLVSLRTLSLNGNNFQTLPSGLFHHTLQLETIQLSGIRNNEMQLPSGLFANLTSLKIIDMYKSGLKELPEDLFWGATGLANISLNNNKLKALPQRIFRDLSNLKQLKLEYNYISALPDNIFSRLGKLQVLDLAFNKLTNVSKDTFSGLEHLDELKLQNNLLHQLHINAFQPMKMLRMVFLANNQLSFMDDAGGRDLFGEYSPLKHCTRLELIDLSNNTITDIFADWRVTMTSLKMLNLSHNLLQFLQFPSVSFTANCKVDVRHNNISAVELQGVEAWALSQPSKSEKSQEWLLEGNPLWCDCSNYELLRYFERRVAPEFQQLITFTPGDLTCAGPPEFENRRWSNVSSREVACPLIPKTGSPCPHGCSCTFRPSDLAVVVDCINCNMTEAPEKLPEVQHSNHTELYLTHNKLRSLPDFSLPGYKNVTKLFVGYNNISALNLTTLPRSMQVLEFHHNNLSVIEPAAIRVISNLTNLTSISLHNNPWICNCAAQPLLDFVQRGYKKIPNREQVKCTDGRKLSALTALGLCSLTDGFVWPLVAVVLLLGLLVSVLAALYYRYKREVKVWLFTHRMCLWFVTEEELDKDKLYDAFVSYSHKDEDFVVNELVPNLEGGPTPFKLCLHFRDWPGGNWITNQIVRSVENSRRTLVVLSPNFLESEWGRVEFRAAHCQALSEGRARVIIILLGDIGPTEDLDPELRAYLNMNTYVKWGDPWFYDKLRYALPHPPELVKGGHAMGLINRSSKHVNGKSLDDKMELICDPNIPAPIVTTPPADENLSDPLSKNKLNGNIPSPQKLPVRETNGTATAVG